MIRNGQNYTRSTLWIDEKGPELTSARILGYKKYGNGVDDILSCEPDVSYILFSQSDKFIVLATPFFWEMMSKEECVEFILKQKSLNANQLLDEARRRWDEKKLPFAGDATCIIIDFRSYENSFNEIFE